MKKSLIAIGIVTLGASLWFNATAADKTNPAGPREFTAFGQGSIRFGDPQGQGVGTLSFSIRKSDTVSGRFVFASEEQHDFPDVVVRLWDVPLAQFAQQTVRFAGLGELHDQPVFITAFGFDGDGTETPDHFSVRVIDIAGDVIFEADGDLVNGNVRVDPS